MGARREPMTPEMAECIASAYQAFQADTPSSLEVCRHCCMEPEIEDTFFDHPIHQLPLAYVRDWFFAASDSPTVSVQLSRYLLPRVMELLAQEQEVAMVGTEVSLTRFATGDTDRWSAAENAVIMNFVRLYLERFRPSKTKTLPEDAVDDVLCMLSSAGHDMNEFLEHLWNWSDEDLFALLARDWDGGYGRPSIWSTAFWEPNDWNHPKHSDNAGKVAKWYRSGEMGTRAKQALQQPGQTSELTRNAGMVLAAIEA